MSDPDDRERSPKSRLRGVLGAVRRVGAEARRTVKGGVAEAGQRLKTGQEAVGAAVELRRVIKQAQEAQRSGNAAEAFRLLEAQVAAHSDDVKLVSAFWGAALAEERVADAVPVMRRLIRRQAGAGKLGRAAELWQELAAGAPQALLDPGTLVRIAPALLEDGQAEAAARALRQAVDERNEGLSPGLAVRVAETARDLAPDVALAAARRALDAPDLHETKRARVAELVGQLEEAVAREAAAAAEAAKREKQDAGPRAARAKPADVAKLDAEGLADEIAALSPSPPEPHTDPSVERFVSLGEDEGEELELAAPSSGVPDTSSANEHFVGLSEDETEIPAGAIAPLDVVPPRLPAPEPAPALELDPEAGSLVAGEPEPVDVPGAAVDDALDALAPATRFAGVKVMEGAPRAFDDEGLVLITPDERRGRVEYAKVQAIAVAEVAGLAVHPVVLVDLLLNWSAEGDTSLRLVRLRSDGFDPRALMPDAEDPTAAFRATLGELLERTGAVPLPDPDAALGLCTPHFDSLAAYQREVLQVGD